MFLINLWGKFWYGPATWRRMQEMQKGQRLVKPLHMMSRLEREDFEGIREK